MDSYNLHSLSRTQSSMPFCLRKIVLLLLRPKFMMSWKQNLLKHNNFFHKTLKFAYYQILQCKFSPGINKIAFSLSCFTKLTESIFLKIEDLFNRYNKFSIYNHIFNLLPPWFTKVFPLSSENRLLLFYISSETA